MPPLPKSSMEIDDTKAVGDGIVSNEGAVLQSLTFESETIQGSEDGINRKSGRRAALMKAIADLQSELIIEETGGRSKRKEILREAYGIDDSSVAGRLEITEPSVTECEGKDNDDFCHGRSPSQQRYGIWKIQKLLWFVRQLHCSTNNLDRMHLTECSLPGRAHLPLRPASSYQSD